MRPVLDMIQSFKGPCSCGLCHDTAIRDIRIGSGIVNEVGDILRQNGFPNTILLVADRNTLAASEGILASLSGFTVETLVYDEIRVAEMKHVEEIEGRVSSREIGILGVGTGSVHDPCRLAAAREGKMLCLFATAPSMDGFASYSSPIVKDGFKASYAAKSPEVIIGDTKILAAAPRALKSAGFGDMIAKYVGLVDWKVSHILTGEAYCERVATLTREATDELLAMADRVTANDEETAGEIFASLLKTGIGMSFMQNSRPASGAEHVIAHLIECIELREGIIPNYHGEDIGVCTLAMLRYYAELATHNDISPTRENVDWEDVFAYYGPMAEEVRALNFPENVTDAVTPTALRAAWADICACIKSIPSYEECLAAMKRAGCKTTLAEIGKSESLFRDCIRYSPFMRRRLTLLRLYGMTGISPV